MTNIIKNSTTELAPETLELIKEAIATELCKRGFHAPLTVTPKHTRNGEVYVGIQSEPFNTVPVIMKSITIDNFGGSVVEVPVDEVGNKRPLLRIWVPVHVSYTHFTGGSNGTALFTFVCLTPCENEYNATLFDTHIS